EKDVFLLRCPVPEFGALHVAAELSDRLFIIILARLGGIEVGDTGGGTIAVEQLSEGPLAWRQHIHVAGTGNVNPDDVLTVFEMFAEGDAGIEAMDAGRQS